MNCDARLVFSASTSARESETTRCMAPVDSSGNIAHGWPEEVSQAHMDRAESQQYPAYSTCEHQNRQYTRIQTSVKRGRLPALISPLPTMILHPPTVNIVLNNNVFLCKNAQSHVKITKLYTPVTCQSNIRKNVIKGMCPKIPPCVICVHSYTNIL